MPLIPLIISLLTSAGANLAANAVAAGKDKVVDFIKEKTGIDLADKAAKNEQLTAEQIMQINQLDFEKLKLELEREKAYLADNQSIDSNTTQRWLSDNTAGGLPAITRPLIVWWLIVAFTLLAILDGNFYNFVIKEPYLKMLESMLMISIPAYMGLRTFEKYKGVQNDDVKK